MSDDLPVPTFVPFERPDVPEVEVLDAAGMRRARRAAEVLASVPLGSLEAMEPRLWPSILEVIDRVVALIDMHSMVLGADLPEVVMIQDRPGVQSVPTRVSDLLSAYMNLADLIEQATKGGSK